MSSLSLLETSNYRCLADLRLDLGPINVFFGPNGSGKSAILDALWFVRDCAVNGVEEASARRWHGIGLLWEGAEESAPLAVTVGTDQVEYRLTLGHSAGRLEPMAGELLTSYGRQTTLIDRGVGSEKAKLTIEAKRHAAAGEMAVTLREPERLSLGAYLDHNANDREVKGLSDALRFTRLYHARSLDFHGLRTRGSDASYETRLEGRGQNLWSVLRNLHDRRSIDERYDTIVGFMRKSFPTFVDLFVEQTGVNVTYAHFLQKGLRKPVSASGASDGHLQMLLLLTALFAEGNGNQTTLLFDEPELSLHPWALHVFAQAVREAVAWGKQVLIATHSPMLLSQFDPAETLATSLADGRTAVRRLSELPEVKELLSEYSAGSLYMAEMIGAQGDEVAVPQEK